jgi:arginase family enzyme
MPTYITLKEVKKRWGHGQEDIFPVAQSSVTWNDVGAAFYFRWIRQSDHLIHAIDQPIVAADIVEYNPRCDNANITAIVAAKLLKEIGGMMLIREK